MGPEQLQASSPGPRQMGDSGLLASSVVLSLGLTLVAQWQSGFCVPVCQSVQLPVPGEQRPGHPSLHAGEEQVALYTLASCPLIQSALLAMALTVAAVVDGPGRSELQPPPGGQAGCS